MQPNVRSTRDRCKSHIFYEATSKKLHELHAKVGSTKQAKLPSEKLDPRISYFVAWKQNLISSVSQSRPETTCSRILITQSGSFCGGIVIGGYSTAKSECRT